MATPILRWKKVVGSSGPHPRPRHGHRAIAIKQLIIIFGGGNEGILNDLLVYNTAKNEWFIPYVKGEIPYGCAAFGMVVYNSRVLIFGGMVEYGNYSNELYELETSRWKWARLNPIPPKNNLPPSPRIGHSFTIIESTAYLFGGLSTITSRKQTETDFYLQYLNDLYTLKLCSNKITVWEKPITYGITPYPRESHTAAAHTDSKGNSRLIIYGGMSGSRLGDLWSLDIGSMTWTELKTSGPQPLPRSLHTATVFGEKMYIFGGWTPVTSDNTRVSVHEWKCSNELACLNLNNLKWEELLIDSSEENMPKARAGHCAVNINERIYIWSGRDGYRKAWNNQVCCNDLWYIAVDRPNISGRVILDNSSSRALDVYWSDENLAEAYCLQVQKLGLLPPLTRPAANAPPKISSVKISHQPMNRVIRPLVPPSVRHVLQSDEKPYLPAFPISSAQEFPAPTKTIERPTSHIQLVPIMLNSNSLQSVCRVTPSSTAPLKPTLTQKSQIFVHELSQLEIDRLLKSNQRKPVKMTMISPIQNKTKSNVTTMAKSTIHQRCPLVRISANRDQISNINILTVLKTVPSKAVTAHKEDGTPLVIKQAVKMPSGPPSVETSNIKFLLRGTNTQSTVKKEITAPALLMPTKAGDSVIEKPISVKLPGTGGTIPGKTSLETVPNILQETNTRLNKGSVHMNNETTIVTNNVVSTSRNSEQTSNTSTPGVNGSNSGHEKCLLDSAKQTSSINNSMVGSVSDESLMTLAAETFAIDSPGDINSPIIREADDAYIVKEVPVLKEMFSDAFEQQALQEKAVELSELNVAIKGECHYKPSTAKDLLQVTHMPGCSKMNNESTDLNSFMVESGSLGCDASLNNGPSDTENNVKKSVQAPDADALTQAVTAPTTEFHRKANVNEKDSHLPSPRSCLTSGFLSLGIDSGMDKLINSHKLKPKVKPEPEILPSEDNENPVPLTPSLPAAPSSIKLSKSADGAYVSWAPVSESENIIYSVFLAVPKNTPSALGFIRVYLGPETQTFIPNSTLAVAKIDNSARPAIIFRVSARNHVGYGPATQVRWVQDIAALSRNSSHSYPFEVLPSKRLKVDSRMSSL